MSTDWHGVTTCDACGATIPAAWAGIPGALEDYSGEHGFGETVNVCAKCAQAVPVPVWKLLCALAARVKELEQSEAKP